MAQVTIKARVERVGTRSVMLEREDGRQVWVRRSAFDDESLGVALELEGEETVTRLNVEQSALIEAGWGDK